MAPMLKKSEITITAIPKVPAATTSDKQNGNAA